MSDSAQIIVDIDATESDAERLATKVVKHMVARGIVAAGLSDCALSGDGHAPGPSAAGVVNATASECKRAFALGANGLAVSTERQVFHTVENGVELRCDKCKVTFEPDEKYEAAAENWFDGNEKARFACPTCKQELLVKEWDGPFVLGLGSLGFEFNNWPPLKPEFVSEIAALLGHRVRVVQQHI